MTHYKISHVTSYHYAEPVSLCQNVAHLALRSCAWQTVGRGMLSIAPVPAVIEERLDYFGNPVHDFTVQEPHRELTVRALHEVEVRARAPLDSAQTRPWEAIRDQLRSDHTDAWLEAYQFAFDSRFAGAGGRYAEFAVKSFTPGAPILEAALDLVHRVHAEFTYDAKATTVATPIAEVYEKRRGVCQDFAHLMLACFRSLGLAARYVSGYLATVPPPGRARLLGADAGHAWVSIFCGDVGWVDLDPTNDLIPDDRHVLVAWGRDYGDVSPLKGVILGGGQHTVRVAVDVVPVAESDDADSLIS